MSLNTLLFVTRPCLFDVESDGNMEDDGESMRDDIAERFRFVADKTEGLREGWEDSIVGGGLLFSM